MPFCINAAKTWNILAFQSFHFKHTKFDIYVFLEWHFNLSNIIFVSFNPSLSLETQFLTKVMLLVLKLYIQTMASMNYIFNIVNGALYMYVLINVLCILNGCLFIVSNLIVCVDDETGD